VTGVDGFNLSLDCEPNEGLDSTNLFASWAGTDPAVQTVTADRSSSSGLVDSFQVSRSQLHDPLSIAFAGATGEPDSTSTVFAQGFVVTNSGGVVAQQPESGFQYALYVEFHVNANFAGGYCSVTGTLLPISGTRTVPLPVVIQPLP
jgi:hypothetical protein